MKKLKILFLYISLLIFIFYRFYSTRPVFSDGDLVKISTTVLSEPIKYSDSQYLKLYGVKIYLPKYPEITYGDKLVIVGRVEEDRLVNPELVEVSDRKNKIYDLRSKIIYFFKSNLPEPHASLVAGMVLGSKNMPTNFWEKLKNTGTAHVVVASGTNVTMVAGFLMGLTTQFLKRRRAIVITLLGIGIYVILSGFDAPIVRAGIMGAVAFSAQSVGRLISAWKALFYSIALMLLVRPDWLVDLGFILSVLATSGILLFNTKLDKIFKIVPKIIREGLTTSLSAQVFVAPVIYATFGQFNILSPIINALILWTVSYIMIIGGISAVISLIVPKVGGIILTLAFPLTWYFIQILNSNF